MKTTVTLTEDKEKYPGLTKCTLRIGSFERGYFVPTKHERFDAEVLAGALDHISALLRLGGLQAVDLNQFLVEYAK